MQEEILEEISVTGSLQVYRVKKEKLVGDLLKEMNLESKYFAILADGKKVSAEDTLKEGSEITILPKIAGGM